MHSIYSTKENKISIDVQGGQLVVSFELNDSVYEKVFLEGPAEFVFAGQVNF